jgi:cholinesterase
MLKKASDCPQTPSKSVIYPLATSQELRIVANFANQNGNPRGEDCLYPNIWSKSTSKATKPVPVFFYGGSKCKFTYSIRPICTAAKTFLTMVDQSTNSPFYDGQYLADSQDTIVVTVNFRINIFGYPGAPGISQNLGLQDQRLAVEWVRDNTGPFSSDPLKITIFGQSPGSVAVSYWAYAYPTDHIVAGLIAHSGDIFSFPVNTPELAAKNWYNASASLGCGDEGDAMDCMRSLDFEDIRVAAAKAPPPPNASEARSQPAFQPVVDNVTVFGDYFSRSAEGKFARIVSVCSLGLE